MIEKMMFVRATGPIERLNEFNLKTLSVDYYHPENAIDYMSGTDGYHAVTEQCPFDLPIKHIEDIAALTDVDILRDASNVFGTDRPITQAYLDKLEKYLSENDFDSSDINVFLSGLKPSIDEYSKRQSELAEREKFLTQKIDQLSHFAALDVNLNDIKTNYIDVHFGSIPKDSIIKLYMYNNDNKIIFNTYSSDDKYFWGVYCAPMQYAAEAEKIMTALYFDELKLNPEEGTVPELIQKYRDELKDIAAEQETINAFWEKNKEELTGDLSILLDLQKLWGFRKYAVVKDDTFCCLGWVPEKKAGETRHLLAPLSDVEFTVKAPESSVTASGITRQSPFETPIRDIEHLSHHVNYPLTPENLHNCIGRNRPLTDEYIKKLTRYLGGADINSDSSSSSGLNGKIHEYSLKRKELKKSERKIKAKVQTLSHFESLDLDLEELMSVSYTVVKFGRLPNEATDEIRREAESKGFIFNVCSSDDTNAWCIYCVPKKYASEVSKIFESVYFKEYKIEVEQGTVSDIIARCRRSLEEIEKEKQLISEFWNEHQKEIVECYSYLQDLQQLWNASKYIAKKNDKYIYTGSASSRDKKKILALCDAVGPFAHDSPDVSETESKSVLTPPTRLKNPLIFTPYEYYVKMYGMPTYGSIDITSFVAITYTLLFGIMFGDLGQGFVLFLGGLFFWKKRKMELARIIIPCGLSSMFFGLIFGSFFGYEELLDPLYTAIGLSGKPLSVMDNINTVLLIAISIGIALVAASILINMYANVKAKKFGAALFDNNGLTGLIFYACGVNLASGLMNGPTPIPNKVCGIVIGVCAVILFFKEILIGIVDKHENWKPDSIGDFVMQNIFELLEYVLSYFSNTVSFLRVGAFVLVHAGMMMVVFSLAGDSENILVIILGNALIICLEGLLTGIQALRLEFYEMFSRCFEGNGIPFVSSREILHNH
ncbi:MAG: hypothetical protein LUH40_09180 [Clostridiales bacterium]|nr:hypothetical protein [Clostridiales bacterium]